MSILTIAKTKVNGLVHCSKKTIKKVIMKATHIRKFNSLPCGSIIPAALLSQPAISFVHIERAFRVRYRPYKGNNKSAETFDYEQELSVEERLRQILQVVQEEVNIDFVTIIEECNDIHGNFHGGLCLDVHEHVQDMVKTAFVTVPEESNVTNNDIDGHGYVQDMVKADFVTIAEKGNVIHNDFDGEVCLDGYEHVQDMVKTDFVIIADESNDIHDDFHREPCLDGHEHIQDMVKTDFVTIADESNDIHDDFHREPCLDLQENVQDITSPDEGSSERHRESDYRFFHDVGSTPVTFESIEEITQAYFHSKKKFTNRSDTLRAFGGRVMASRGLGHNRRESGDIFVAGMLEDMAADLAKENDDKEDLQDLDYSVIYDDENDEAEYATQLDLRSICFSATAMGIYNEEVDDPMDGNEHHGRVLYYDDDDNEDERSDEERVERAVSRPGSAMGFYDDKEDETDFVQPVVAVTIDEQEQPLEALVPTVTTMYSSSFAFKKRRPRFPRYVRKVSEPVGLNTIYEIDPEEEYEVPLPEDQGAYFSEDSSEYSYCSDYESEETLVDNNKTPMIHCPDFCEDHQVDLSTLDDEELMKYLFGRPTIPVYENSPIVFCHKVFLTEDNVELDNHCDVGVQVIDPERLSPYWLPRATPCQ